MINRTTARQSVAASAELLALTPTRVYALMDGSGIGCGRPKRDCQCVVACSLVAAAAATAAGLHRRQSYSCAQARCIALAGRRFARYQRLDHQLSVGTVDWQLRQRRRWRSYIGTADRPHADSRAVSQTVQQNEWYRLTD